MATFGVEAWENEEPSLVIVGTHDRALALKAATKPYMDLNGELPDDLTMAISDATEFWVNRDHPA